MRASQLQFQVLLIREATGYLGRRIRRSVFSLPASEIPSLGAGRRTAGAVGGCLRALGA